MALICSRIEEVCSTLSPSAVSYTTVSKAPPSGLLLRMQRCNFVKLLQRMELNNPVGGLERDSL